MSKKCTKCGETKDLGDFGKNRTKSDGLQVYCKACRNKHRRTDKGRNSAYNRSHYRDNREKYISNATSYYENNKDSGRYKDSTRLHYKNNKAKYAASQKAYRENNKDKVNASRQKRRAMVANAAGSFTPLDWRSRLDYYGGKCVYCGSTENIEIEHRIPLSRGGTNFPANLVPACKSCNCSKGTKTEKEFKQHLALKGN